MKNKTLIHVIFSATLAAFLLTGCATYPTFYGILGAEIRDLEKAKENGRKMLVSMPCDAAFDRVLDILKENSLTVFQQNKKARYIVAMGFPKQTDTTRVGIFFEPEGDGNTLITLSSLSSTALARADSMIFGKLKGTGPDS